MWAACWQGNTRAGRVSVPRILPQLSARGCARVCARTGELDRHQPHTPGNNNSGAQNKAAPLLMRSATVAPEKGAAAARIGARPTGSVMVSFKGSERGYEGIHNAAMMSPKGMFAPNKFRLEHYLDEDHPLRHPKAVHWRSAYSVIALHKNLKNLRAGGGNYGMEAPSSSPDPGPATDKYEELMKENATLQQQLEVKTTALQEMTNLLTEKDALLTEKDALLTEKDAQLEEAQAKAQDMTAKMAQLAKSGVDIDSLLSKVEEMEQFRQKLVAKAARRWKNADISRAFHRWRGHVAETVRNRNLIVRFSARWNTNSLAGVFVRWHDKTKQEKKNRAIIRRFAVRFKKQLEFKCFAAWHSCATEGARLKGLYMRVAQRFKQQRLASAFHGWHNNVHEVLHNRALLQRFSMRLKNSHMISSFASWHHFAEERRHVRRTMTKYLRNLIRADEVMVFSQWKRYSNWYAKHANESTKHELTTRVHDLEAQLEASSQELEEFRAVFARKRDKFIAALKSRVRLETMHKLMDRWTTLVHKRISARRTINRLLNKQLAAGFHSWVSHDLHLQEDLHIRALAAAGKKQERDRKKAVLNRTLKHMMQRKMSATFRKWRDDVREIVHNRVVVARFVGRWKNQDLHHRFSRWLRFTDDSIHEKASARKVMIRIAHTLEMAAMTKWVEVVNMLKDEAEKRHHDEIVLERFVRRWKSLDLHKRFDRWKNFWVHEKHNRSTQQQLATLRKEYEEKLGGIEEARRREQEHRVRKAIAAWLNNNLAHCFHRWRELITRLVRERNTVAKFVLQWQNASFVCAFRTWVTKVREKKRATRIVLNMWTSRSRRTLVRCYRAWKEVAADNAKNQRLLKRFGKRWRNLELAAVWSSWTHYVDLRCNARSLVANFYNRWQNGRLSMGFRAWVSYSLRCAAWLEGEKLIGDVRRQRQ